MSKELKALDRLWNETKGIFNTSSFSNRSDRDLIKQALIDKDTRIKELKDKNDILNNAYELRNTQKKALKSKLDKIEEEVNIFNKLDVEYEMNDIDNILKFVNILLCVLKESE